MNSEETKRIIDFNKTLATYPCRQCSIGRPEVTYKPEGIIVSLQENLTPVVIVLSYPKKIDQDKCKIYQTPDKDRFKKWLNAAGFNSFYMTNALKCNTDDNECPAIKDMKTCASIYLKKEIECIKPKVVVTLGKTPLQAMFPSRTEEAIKHMMMKRHEGITSPYSLYSLHHPAFMDRGGLDHEDDCIKLLTQAFEENKTCQMRP